MTATITETATSERVEDKPSASPEPTTAKAESGPTTHQPGEAVELLDSVVIIHSATQVDEIAGDYGQRLSPGPGESLWLLEMEWTNTSNQAVSKVCWGPDSLRMMVFDTQDREMLLDHGSGSIPGNDCTNGLLTGQSGEWFAAYNGLERAEIGYVVLAEGFNADPEVVILDDSIEIVYRD